MKATRKEFLKTVSVGMLGAATFGTLPAFGKKTEITEKLNFGIASYSFREFSLEDTIVMTKRMGVKHLALKSMHMPLDSSPEQIKTSAGKVRTAGINLYGAGVIYMNTEAEVNNTFAYANAADLKVIIGVPAHDLLPLVNEKVKEFNIKVAIHNHGPGDNQYSSPDDVYEKIKDLDNRLGLCLDIGHTFRIGQDPVTMLKKYKDRLYDVHFKDIDKSAEDGENIECGRGVMDLPPVLQVLQEINYDGIVAFEYEKDGKDPLPGAAESVGYARGVLDAL
jgi:sugar phosphate isomerase/epimerase